MHQGFHCWVSGRHAELFQCWPFWSEQWWHPWISQTPPFRCFLMCPVRCRCAYGWLQPRGRFGQRKCFPLKHTKWIFLFFGLFVTDYVYSNYINMCLTFHGNHLSFCRQVTVHPLVLQVIPSWLQPQHWGSQRYLDLWQSNTLLICCHDAQFSFLFFVIKELMSCEIRDRKL